MTITASFALFSPEMAECLDEAFERAGLAPQNIGVDHITSAMRSIKFMLNSEWQTLGKRQWMVVQGTQATAPAMSNFDLPVGAIEVCGMMLRRANADTVMTRISREDYLEIPNKFQNGRPDRYFVDRQYNGCNIKLWRTAENNTDIIVFDYMRQMAAPGRMANTLQLPPFALEAFVSGLAARLAQKFNRAEFVGLQTLYRGPDVNKIGGALKACLEEDRERADVTFSLHRR